jgi:hypothetical protein
MGTWKPVGTGLWVRVYHFRGNPINSLAVALGGGGLAVLSPGTNVPEQDYAELDAFGTVKALVSPGAFHNMGLPAWSQRYPAAGIYGPNSAIAHIAKAHKTLKPLQNFDALARMLPKDVSITEMPEMRHPDAMVIVKRDDALTWFTNECITNLASLPKNPIFALLFHLTGSGPGLNINKLAVKLIGAKNKPLLDYLLVTLAANPPTRLVPCHGQIINDPKLPERMREMLTRRLG